MEIVQHLVAESKYGIKCPYVMNPDCIVIHNTANDASAYNEISYMIRNNEQVSFHFAVDDIQVIQGIPLNRNTWNAGDGANGRGNRKGISIEICYSKSGGPRFTSAEKLCAKFVAQLLNERKWGIEKVLKHQDFSGKYCPHRTLDMGWERFLKMVLAELNRPTPNPSVSPLNGFVEVIYRGADGVDLHTTPTFEGNVKGVATKGDVFTVIGKVMVNGYPMYKLKSGLYITATKAYVTFRTTLHAAPPIPLKELRVGSTIMIKSSATKYATGQTIANQYKNVRYIAQQVSADKSKVLVKELYSWVYAKDVTVL